MTADSRSTRPVRTTGLVPADGMADRLPARARRGYQGVSGGGQAGVSTVKLVVLLPLVVFLTFLGGGAVGAMLWRSER